MNNCINWENKIITVEIKLPVYNIEVKDSGKYGNAECKFTDAKGDKFSILVNDFKEGLGIMESLIEANTRVIK